MKLLKFLFITLLIVGIAMFAGSPYYTAYQLKKAYDANDGAALVSHINFDQVQPNIHNQLTTKLDHTFTAVSFGGTIGWRRLN